MAALTRTLRAWCSAGRHGRACLCPAAAGVTSSLSHRPVKGTAAGGDAPRYEVRCQPHGPPARLPTRAAPAPPPPARRAAAAVRVRAAAVRGAVWPDAAPAAPPVQAAHVLHPHGGPLQAAQALPPRHERLRQVGCCRQPRQGPGRDQAGARQGPGAGTRQPLRTRRDLGRHPPMPALPLLACTPAANGIAPTARCTPLVPWNRHSKLTPPGRRRPDSAWRR